MTSIERIGKRLTVAEQLSRDPQFKGRPLALEFKDPSGKLLRASEVITAGALGIGSIISSAAMRAHGIIIPEMVTSAIPSFSIMRAPVTVEMFRQFVEDRGYKIAGYNSDKLLELLADPKKSDHSLTYVSYEDANAFVNWRREKTDQNLRIPMDSERKDADLAVGGQLTGDLLEWTQTLGSSGVTRVLRSTNCGDQRTMLPEGRYQGVTIRLFIAPK